MFFIVYGCFEGFKYKSKFDRLREELAPKVKQVNAMMVRVKEAYAEKKRTLKCYYPQERWIDYGVPDKR